MEIFRTVRPKKKDRADVKLWLCEGCDVVHMSVGKALLNFDRDEFADFAAAVNELGTSNWLNVGGSFSILDLVSLESEAVH